MFVGINRSPAPRSPDFRPSTPPHPAAGRPADRLLPQKKFLGEDEICPKGQFSSCYDVSKVNSFFDECKFFRLLECFNRFVRPHNQKTYTKQTNKTPPPPKTYPTSVQKSDHVAWNHGDIFSSKSHAVLVKSIWSLGWAGDRGKQWSGSRSEIAIPLFVVGSK